MATMCQMHGSCEQVQEQPRFQREPESPVLAGNRGQETHLAQLSSLTPA